MSMSKTSTAQAKSPPKPRARFFPTPSRVVAKYTPNGDIALDGGVALSFAIEFERNEAGRATAAVFNFGGNATQRVQLPEGTLLGKTAIASLSVAFGIDIAKLEKTYGFTYGILPLLGETDLTCDTKADGTAMPKNSRTIRAKPLHVCRSCGFRIVDKPITSAHGVNGETVAVHDKCLVPFTFMAGDATFAGTPIKVDGKDRIGLTETTGLYRLVDFNYVPITAASALLDLSFDGTDPDDASSVCSARTAQEEDDAPIAKAAPKKRAPPAAAPSCAAPSSKKRKIDLALDELEAIFAAGQPSQMHIAALLGRYVRDD